MNWPGLGAHFSMCSYGSKPLNADIVPEPKSATSVRVKLQEGRRHLRSPTWGKRSQKIQEQPHIISGSLYAYQ